MDEDGCNELTSKHDGVGADILQKSEIRENAGVQLNAEMEELARHRIEFLTAKSVLSEFIKEIKLTCQTAGCKQHSFLALFEKHSEDCAKKIMQKFSK